MVAAAAIPLLSCPRCPAGPFVKAHLAGGRMIGRVLSHEEALLARNKRPARFIRSYPYSSCRRYSPYERQRYVWGARMANRVVAVLGIAVPIAVVVALVWVW